MEASKKKDMMKKLKMPGKPHDPMLDSSDDLAGLDQPESQPEEPSEESPAMEGQESSEEELKELHEIDDKMLVDELKKRGFKVEPPAKGEGEEELPADGESMPTEQSSSDQENY